jgi:hypothetical protein
MFIWLSLKDEDGAVDLNKLYFDHQIALMQAGSAGSGKLRRDRQFDASLLAGRIGCMQRSLGASAALGWESLAAPDASELAGRSLGLRAPGWREDLSPPRE